MHHPWQKNNIHSSLNSQKENMSLKLRSKSKPPTSLKSYTRTYTNREIKAIIWSLANRFSCSQFARNCRHVKKIELSGQVLDVLPQKLACVVQKSISM